MEKIAFGLIKISILLLWMRLLGRVQAFSPACRVMVVIIFLWSTSFFAIVFRCGTQWPKNWATIGDFLTQCSDTLLILTVFTGPDQLTDFITMFMPVPIIWRLHMSMKRKLGVTSIFMVGLLVYLFSYLYKKQEGERHYYPLSRTIGAGIARTYFSLVTSYDKETNPDFIGDFTLFILCSEIEVNVGMIVCCMPTCLFTALGIYTKKQLVDKSRG